jgi:hypothetical protein
MAAPAKRDTGSLSNSPSLIEKRRAELVEAGSGVGSPPTHVLALAEKVNGVPIAWAIKPDKTIIVFEDGRKLTFERDDSPSVERDNILLSGSPSLSGKGSGVRSDAENDTAPELTTPKKERKPRGQ